MSNLLSPGKPLPIAAAALVLCVTTRLSADVLLDSFASGAFSLGPNGTSSSLMSSPLGAVNRVVTTSANWTHPRLLTFTSSGSGAATMDYFQLGAAPSGPAVTNISLAYSGNFNLSGASTIELLGSGVFSDHGQGSGAEIFRFTLSVSDGIATKSKNITMADGQFHSLGNLTWSLSDSSFSGLNWSSISDITISYYGYNNKVSGNGSELNYTTTGVNVGGITIAPVPGAGLAALVTLCFAGASRRRRR